MTLTRFQVTVTTAHCAAPESQNRQPKRQRVRGKNASRKRQEAKEKGRERGREIKGANINHKLEAAAGMEATQNEALDRSGSKNAE